MQLKNREISNKETNKNVKSLLIFSFKNIQLSGILTFVSVTNLHHSRTCHYNRGADIIKLINTLEKTIQQKNKLTNMHANSQEINKQTDDEHAL